MLSTRLRTLTAMVFALCPLSREDFDRLPLASPKGPARKTVDTYRRAVGRSRYTGAALRQIRATGQARECARRRKALGAAA